MNPHKQKKTQKINNKEQAIIKTTQIKINKNNEPKQQTPILTK